MTHRRPRLVCAWPYGSSGGSQIYLLQIATSLKQDFDLAAVMPAAASPALQRYWKGIGAECRLIETSIDERTDVRGLDRLRRRLRQWRTEWELWRAIRGVAREGSVLHLDLAPWTSFWLISLLACFHPVVVTLHTRAPRPGWARRVAWRLKLAVLTRRKGFRITVASRHVLDSLSEYLPAGVARNIPVAYSTVDLGEIDRASEGGASTSAPREPNSAPLTVVTAGQFIERKGPWVLLEAARALVATRHDVRFCWLCPVPPSTLDRRRIDGFGLGSRFSWRSFDQPGDTREELLRVVARADVFVLPSLEEGLPLALVEAMALGVPVIATRTNGVPEAITDGMDGVLVEPGDVTGLTAALAEVLASPHLRARLSAAGCERARRQFDSRTTARTLRVVYRDLLDLPAPADRAG